MNRVEMQTAIGDTARERGGRRDVHAADASFAERIATYYPYAQPPCDPQPRAGQADPRTRGNTISAPGGPQRRQSRRGDS